MTLLAEETYTCAREKTIRKEDNIILILFATKSKSIAQVKAAIKVNTELLRLYWRMGADICEKQKSATWGDGWLKELSRELMAEFPNMKGFSS